MTTPAIKVEGLWKQYTVGTARRQHNTFYDLLAHSLRAPFERMRRLGGRNEATEQFWALRDIGFEVRPGDVLGIVGRNGAGKSTLLKILSRITAPTRGRVTVHGRLASLLEVGTGFHPELSGRENIFLNGAILGMKRAEIVRKFDEIVDFAEVEKFIDTPVKRYSSGMYVRLAFGVAASLDSDVLVVDEVLAVGDSSFQEKCMNKMGDLSKGGRTVLFVSHNLGAISRLCNRCVVLAGGQVGFDGSVTDALVHYSKDLQASKSITGVSIHGQLAEKIDFASFHVNDSDLAIGNVFKPEQPIVLRVAGTIRQPIKDFRVTFCVFKQGQMVLGLHDLEVPRDTAEGRFESTVTIPPFLLSPGDYMIDIGAYSTKNGEWVMAKNIGLFSIATEWYPLYEPTNAMGLINLRQAGQRSENGR